MLVRPISISSKCEIRRAKHKFHKTKKFHSPRSSYIIALDAYIFIRIVLATILKGIGINLSGSEKKKKRKEIHSIERIFVGNRPRAAQKPTKKDTYPNASYFIQEYIPRRQYRIAIGIRDKWSKHLERHRMK